MSEGSVEKVAAHGSKPTSSVYMIAFLGAVSTFCGLVIVSAYAVTMPYIKENLATITRDAVFEILPEAAEMSIYAVEAPGGLAKQSDLESPLPKVFACYDKAGALVGVACEGEGQGYAGPIKVLYAYDPAKEQITGFKVIESNETPGLGDKIASDSGFLANFGALDAKLDDEKTGLAHSIKTVKHGTKNEPWQIDAISGATVSSNAVGKLMDESTEKLLPVIAAHVEQLRKGA